MINDTVSSDKNISSIGIVGGGKVGLQLLNLFTHSKLARVAYVVDMEGHAPAMLAAHEAKLATFTDINQAIRSTRVDFIFEVTGSERVVEIIQQALANQTTQLITHDMAHIILTVIEENRQRTTDLVAGDILAIKNEIAGSLDTVANAIGDIKQTTSDMRYLALNARIEAARAGEQGKGFNIVAQQVEQLAGKVRDMAQEVERVNKDLLAISGKIETSLGKLK
jgi:methyl-accepting chemotaxis protein